MKRARKMWYVDLPDPRNLKGEWIHVGEFKTRKEARKFCKENGLEHSRPGTIDVISGIG